MSMRKWPYKYVLKYIFWKCLDSAEFNFILLLVISSWHLFVLNVVNSKVLRFKTNLLALFCFVPLMLKKLVIILNSHLCYNIQ